MSNRKSQFQRDWLDANWDMFVNDLERLTRVYIEAYVQRQARICMNYLSCTSVREAALDAILSTLKAE